MRIALDDVAIAGKILPGTHQHQIAGVKRDRWNVVGLPVTRKIAQAMRRKRQRLIEVFEIRGRPLARPHLEPARAQQEEDEHGDGVEIHFGTARERGNQAGAEGNADAQRHGDVHAGFAPSQIAPGAAKKWRRGEKHHRHGQHQTGQAHQQPKVRAHAALVREIGRQGVHHHLHHAETGHEKLPQGGARFAPARLLRVGRSRRPGAITDRFDLREDCG